MKITPKLLIGKCIKDSNKISEAEKINMLSEIMYLNEAELNAWIEMTLLDESGVLNSLFEGVVSKAAAGIKKVATKRGFEKTAKYFTPTDGTVIDRVVRGTRKKAWEKPIRTVAKAAIGGTVVASAYKYISNKLNACKQNCKASYKASKDADKFSKCMELCQTVANKSIAAEKAKK